jgi:hypothetical protein
MPAPEEFHDSTLYLIFSGKRCKIQELHSNPLPPSEEGAIIYP